MVRNFLRALRLLIGLLSIGVSLWALSGQRGIDEQYGEALVYLEAQVAEGIPTLQADFVDSNYEGRLVHVTGPISFNPVTDLQTGLSLNALYLTRHVEMLQWDEEDYRDSKGKREYRKLQVWSERVISESSFHEIVLLEDHSNPGRLPFETGVTHWSESVQLGDWPVSAYAFIGLTEPRPFMPDHGQPPAISEDWVWLNSFLQPRSQVAEVGAIRLSYEYAPLEQGTYSVMGKVVNGLIEDTIYGELRGLPVAQKGFADSADLVRQVRGHLEQGYTPQKHWIGYTFVGLLLVIGVLARWIPIPLFQTYTRATLRNRVLVSLVLAAVGTVLLGTLA